MSVNRFINVEELNIRNPLFLNQSNADLTSTSSNLGLISKYSNGINIVHTGLYRSATDSMYYLFDGLITEPNVYTGFINTADIGYVYASLVVQNFVSNGDATITGSLTVSGDVMIVSVENLAVKDNIVIANAGPTGVKTDGGFVINRSLAEIITDTPKFTGIASDNGTTTTITLASGNLKENYYVGWVIKFTGDVFGSAFITASSSGNPTIVTFDTESTGSTTTNTIYQLYNKAYVGTIWDESESAIVSYGFPRTDVTGIIDPSGSAGNGNLAEYMNVKVNDADIARNLHINGVITSQVRVEDNIMTVNANASNITEDAGYVIERSPLNVVLHDTPKISNVAISSNYTHDTFTLQITNTAVGANYFKGWVIRYNSNSSEATTIVSSTEFLGVHTLTLLSGFSVDLIAGVDIISLYNKRYVGTIWDESIQNYTFGGFPRELNENVIDPLLPINGNILDYCDLTVNNVTIKGLVTLTNSILFNTMTQVAPIVFTPDNIIKNDIIYLAPVSDATYVLPAISTIAIGPNSSKVLEFINMSNSKAIIQANALDTIEGRPQIILKKLYSKTVFVLSDQMPNNWGIKG